MPDPIAWPTSVLPFQDIEFTLVRRSTSGGASASGSEQVVASGADRWMASIRTKLTRRDQILELRALIARSDGRVGTWLIPPCAGYQVAGGIVDGHVIAIQSPPAIVSSRFSDTATFSDGSGFATSVPPFGLVTSVAAARARSLTIQMQGGVPAPLPGTFFSVGQRLYEVAATVDNGDGTATLSVRPGLREAVAIGDNVEFQNPVCLMRMARDDGARIKLDLLKFGDVPIDFVEAF